MVIAKKSDDSEKRPDEVPQSGKLSANPRIQTAEGWKRNRLKEKHESKKREPAE